MNFTVQEVLSALPFLAVVLSGIVWAFVYVSKQNSGLRVEIMARIEALGAIESKARHDLRNEVQRITGSHDAAIDRLEREMVRREEVQALETRVGVALNKMELKIDRMGEKLEGIQSIRDRTEANGKLLDRVIARLEVIRAPTEHSLGDD